MPDAVVGHSAGEVAAAHVAGVLDLEDAVRLIVQRGRAMAPGRDRGRMVAVGLAPDEARTLVEGDEVAVARQSTGPRRRSSPARRTRSSASAPRPTRAARSCRLLPGAYAFHSPQMEPLQDELMEALADIEPRPATLPIFSTLTGAPAEPGDYDAAYWVRHLRETVLFADAVDRLADEGHDVYLELSPSPTLLGAVTQCLSHRGETGTAIGSLKRDEPDRARLLGALGALYTAGRPLDWTRLYPAVGRFVRLPSYPWQRERCWFEHPADARRQREWSSGGERPHALLGRRWSSAHPTWGAELQADGPLAYLADHRVQDTVLFPGTGYVEMALAAAAEAFPGRPVVLSEVEFRKALVVSDDAPRRVQTVVVPEGASEAALSIYVAPDEGDEWTCCAHSRVRLGGDPGAGSDVDGSLADIRARCATEVTGEDLYAALARGGLRYGPGFRGIERVWVGDGEAVGRLAAPAAIGADLERYRVHPALLDACLHVIQGAMREGDRQGTFLPVGIAEVRVRRAIGPSAWSHARIRKLGRSPEVDITVFDDEGRIAVELRGFRLQLLEAPRSPGIAASPDDWLYELSWPAAPVEGDASRPSGSAAPGTWIVLADAAGVGEEIARRLSDRGDGAVLVRPGRSFERLDDGSFRIEPGSPDGFAKLLEALAAAGGPPCRGVVHLWAAELPGAGEPTVDLLHEAQELGCVSALHVVQALAGAGWSPAPRLWLVTRASQHAGGVDPVGLGGSSLWGLGRVVAHEHPELRCASVDLSAEAGPEEIAALVDEPFDEGRNLCQRLGPRRRFGVLVGDDPAQPQSDDPPRPTGSTPPRAATRGSPARAGRGGPARAWTTCDALAQPCASCRRSTVARRRRPVGRPRGARRHGTAARRRRRGPRGASRSLVQSRARSGTIRRRAARRSVRNEDGAASPRSERRRAISSPTPAASAKHDPRARRPSRRDETRRLHRAPPARRARRASRRGWRRCRGTAGPRGAGDGSRGTSTAIRPSSSNTVMSTSGKQPSFLMRLRTPTGRWRGGRAPPRCRRAGTCPVDRPRTVAPWITCRRTSRSAGCTR